MIRSLTCCLILALTLSARSGSISGTVTAEGNPEAQSAGASGRYDSRKFKFVDRINYAELRDFVVSIEGPVAGMTNRPPETLSVVTTNLTQRDAVFKPHVLPVFAGTTVQWPNEDDIFHNVFSMSETKPFDLGLYKGSPKEKAIVFDKTGRVDVFCSIHSQMHCVVLVLENPFFCATDSRGRYAIRDVPGGKYKLRAWHERLPSLTQEITVPEQGEAKMDFTLGIKNLPKY
jgi:plastocyanin